MTKPTILILGARSDIARALAREYAHHGYDLQLAARRAKSLAADAEDLRIRFDCTVTLHDWDAAESDKQAQFYSQLPTRPDGVICVAGYLGEQARGQHDWPHAREILHTNFTGLVAILNVIAIDFENRGTGFIVGISSVAGDRGRQSNYLYGAAKAGFTTYLSGLRNRLCRRGVQVLTVKPGFVLTSMTRDLELPARLTVSPQRVARDIYRAQQKHKNVIYTPAFWRLIMLIICLIPERIFKRMSL